MRLAFVNGTECLVRLLVVALALCAMIRLAPQTARAQTEAELEAQIQEGLKNAQELLDNLPKLQQIEAEEAAMRALLNRTQDDLLAERARSQALEAQLRGLTGQETTSSTTGSNATPEHETISQPSESERWLALPARRVNALGMLDTTRQPIGTVPQGTENVVPGWPVHLQLPEGVAWPSVDTQGTKTLILQNGTLGGQRVLATLEVRGTQAFWSWRGGGGTEAGYEWLEPLLRRCRFEALRTGVALASYQATPRALSLPEPIVASRSLTLGLQADLGIDPSMGPISLAVEQDGDRAHRLESDTTSAAWVLRDATLFLDLASDLKTLSIRRGPGLDGRLVALQRQRQAWQRDMNPGPDRVAPEPAVLAQAQAEITRLDEQIAALRTLQEAMDQPNPDAANGLQGYAGSMPIVRLVDAQTGVVLLRLSLSSRPLTPQPLTDR